MLRSGWFSTRCGCKSPESVLCGVAFIFDSLL
jgi:hypothetical protein